MLPTDAEKSIAWQGDEEDIIKHNRSSLTRGESKGTLLYGLTSRSEDATQWIHSIPYYVKPAIPGFFNLLNSSLRWASLVYVTASVAEMLISGLELVLSVIAARVIRRRLVSLERWIGVGLLVTAGVIATIGLVDYYIAACSNGRESLENIDEKQSSQKDITIGIVLIIGQSILSVLQDIAEELFMQASDFPPTLMSGMEGAFGLVFGLLLYFICGKRLGEDPGSTLQLLRDRPQMLGWIIGLPPLFLVAGIFNIKATEVTSSMTRNVWKNFRTVLVWVLSLLIFYTSGNSEIGEVWRTPGSFYILLGFFTMTAGILVYYSQKKKEEDIIATSCHDEDKDVTKEDQMQSAGTRNV